MSDAQKPGDIPAPTPEELKLEEEALNEPSKDEVRTSVIEKFGLTEDSQSDLVDKLVEETLEQKKVLGKAIKQKRDWRDKAKPKEEIKTPEVKDDKTSDDEEVKQPSIIEQAKQFNAIKDMDEKQLSYIEMISQAQKLSISEASKSEEFQLWNESYQKKVEEEKATPNPSSKQTSDADSDVSTMTVDEILALPPLDPRRKKWNKLQSEKARS